MRPGPTPGATLSTPLRRLPAALTIVAFLAVTLTTTQPAADSHVDPPGSHVNQVAVPFDAATEARDLVAAERASRTKPTPVVHGFGQATVTSPKAGPKKQPPTPSRPATRSPSKRRESAPAEPVPAAGNLAVVIAYAMAQRGKPYRWASAGPHAFDCSGLVKASYARIGVHLPHQSGGIASRGRQVPRVQLRPGDVLAWPGHVALALGGNQMIHASRPGVPVRVATIYGSPRVVRIVN